MGKRYSRQQAKKLYEKTCIFCGEEDYDLLDAHRIVPGNEGGLYNPENVTICCASCHRRCHSGKITIDRYYNSTSGKPVLHCWVDGEEKWL